MFVIRTIQKVVSSLEFMSQFLDVVVVSPGSIVPVKVLIRTVQQNHGNE